MKKIIIITSFVLASVSIAAPIIGSKQSVALSNFCKKYNCVLVRSGPLDPKRPTFHPEFKSFDYKVKDYTLNVIRDTRSNVVNSAGFSLHGSSALVLAYRGNSDSYINDFSLSFAGFQPQTTLSDACLGQLGGDNRLTSGTMGQGAGGLTISCLAAMASPSGFPNKTIATVSIGQ